MAFRTPLFFFSFHSLLVLHPSFQLSLRELSCGNYFDQLFQMQSFFPPLPLLFVPAQSARCHSPLCLYLSPSLLCKSNFFFFFTLSIDSCRRLFLEGRGGQGCELTLGSIDDLCVCVCASQGFSVVLLSSPRCVCVPLGWEGGQHAVQRTVEKHKPGNSAASN